jgi:hypothetical protein
VSDQLGVAVTAGNGLRGVLGIAYQTLHHRIPSVNHLLRSIALKYRVSHLVVKPGLQPFL